MIVVVEGPSAAGKTTWCRRHASEHLVAETDPGAFATTPPRPATAKFTTWQEENERRWERALEMERRTGVAVCDGDPLKLHYIWSLWQAGHAPEAEWQYAVALARAGCAAGRLGLADQILLADPSEDELRRRRACDPARTRRRFELHLSLRRPLRAWYEAVAAIEPRRVLFDLPDSGLADPRLVSAPRDTRTGQALFDRVIVEAMRRSDPAPPVDEDDWYRRTAALLEDAYLAAADLAAGSGKSGGLEGWARGREVIAEAIDRSGTFLDVGCANGLLMESMVGWAAGRGHVVEPYGLDISSALASVAAGRLPAWAQRIFTGNAMTWEPPRRFDFVRTELAYVPRHRRGELARRLLDRVVAPGGRLIVCSYGSGRRPEVPAEPAAETLAAMGFTVTGDREAYDAEGQSLTRIAWIDRRS